MSAQRPSSGNANAGSSSRAARMRRVSLSAASGGVHDRGGVPGREHESVGVGEPGPADVPAHRAREHGREQEVHLRARAARVAALPVVEGEVDELVDDVLDDLPVGERRLRVGVQPLDCIGFQRLHGGRIAVKDGCQPVVRRRKRCVARGTKTSRIAADHASAARTGCCIGHAWIHRGGIGTAEQRARRRRHRTGRVPVGDDLQPGYPAVPLRDRVRMVAAVGAIMAGLVLSGDLLKDVPTEELTDLTRDAVHDLLDGRGAPRSRRTRRAI